ncbi:hypothetical protein [Bradyrhizobium ottawaense]|uniref:pPIWI-associating nuclease domain-containing protein n=1 Tax=Bradyrhizobium ottawaense TaxID=931866 RepID=UPI003CC7E1D5
MTQEDNPARANQSASSFRELTAHVLEAMAPTADVMRCDWFKQDKNVEGPTRRQRALYTCRGGLTDEFLKDKLGIKASELHRGLGDAFQELNKRTHVRPDTELTSEAEIDEFSDAALIALHGAGAVRTGTDAAASFGALIGRRFELRDALQRPPRPSLEVFRLPLGVFVSFILIGQVPQRGDYGRSLRISGVGSNFDIGGQRP